MTHFFSLDVETANVEISSICQIGIVEFIKGEIVSTWQTLVNPETYFDDFNVSIHGINPELVEKSPTYPQVAEIIQNKLGGQVVVTHMPFDQNALKKASHKYNLPEILCDWLDSARVARRQWEQFRRSGYNLPNLSRFLGISYKHHDAAEDARAAGLIVAHVLKETDKTIDELLKSSYKRITNVDFTQEGNPDGPFYGETIVFTGALSLPRKEAACLAANAGCKVDDSVTKATTILVVGMQDIDKLAGYSKSSKHRKAEELACKGQLIKIISEKDFQEIISLS